MSVIVIWMVASPHVFAEFTGIDNRNVLYNFNIRVASDTSFTLHPATPVFDPATPIFAVEGGPDKQTKLAADDGDLDFLDRKLYAVSALGIGRVDIPGKSFVLISGGHYTGLASNQADDLLYATTSGRSLVTISPLGGTHTIKSDLGIDVRDLAYDDSGRRLYGLASDAHLYRIDENTGAVAVVGSTAFGEDRDYALAFAEDSRAIIAGTIHQSLYILDPDTGYCCDGQGRHIGVVSGQMQGVFGLAWVDVSGCAALTCSLVPEPSCIRLTMTGAAVLLMGLALRSRSSRTISRKIKQPRDCVA
jgi:hypothetical protein